MATKIFENAEQRRVISVPSNHEEELRRLRHSREIVIRNMETIQKVGMEMLHSLKTEIDELGQCIASP